MLICHLYILFSVTSLHILCSFSNWIVRFFNLLSFKMIFLDTIPLPDMWFANILSQSVGYVFILTGSFTEQKFLILMKSNLFFFSVIDYAFRVISKNSSPSLGSLRFSPLSSSKSVVILSFTFKSTIQFELNYI